MNDLAFPKASGKFSKPKRGGGESRGEGNYCSWLERLPGMLGRPRPTTGEEGLQTLEGEAAEGGARSSIETFSSCWLPGAHGRAGDGRGEGRGGSERPRKMKASIHPSSTAPTAQQQLGERGGTRQAGDGGPQTSE